MLLTIFLGNVSGAIRKESAQARKLAVDGPYLFHNAHGGLRVVSVDQEGKLRDDIYPAVPPRFTFNVYSDAGEKLFPVALHPVSRPTWKEEQP